MTQGFYQRIALTGRITNMQDHIGMPAMKSLDGLDETPKATFKDTINNLASSLNKSMNTPDQMMTSVMSGNTDIDIHDVMTAMAKAEMSVSVATQITSKVIQAYDKIMQISV